MLERPTFGLPVHTQLNLSEVCPRSTFPPPWSSGSGIAIEVDWGVSANVRGHHCCIHFALVSGLGASWWVIKLSVFLIHSVMVSCTPDHAGRKA